METKETSKNNAILITSCDKYSDLWEPFFKLFFENWPDCPYQVYLSSNKKPFETDLPVKNILTHDDPDWSTSFRKVLKEIKEENLFVWMEDAFIVSKINSVRFEETFKFMSKKSANHIHFRPLPKPDRLDTSSEDLGIYEKSCPYRISAVGFWKKDYLNSLLLPGENPWNFEIMGSYRSSYSDGFYCLMKQPLEWIHVVDKGSWLPNAINYCQKNNIRLDLAKRPKIIGSKRLISIMKSAFFNLMIGSNWRIRLGILNFLRKVFASY